MSSLVEIPCTISRGPFSGERLVEISKDGFEYSTAVPVHYCVSNDGKELTEEMPARGTPLSGRLRVRVTSKLNEIVTLAIPDGQVIEAPSSLLSLS